MKTIFITGGYGFIGSSLIRILLKKNIFRIVNLDKLTYSSNLNSIPKNKINLNYKFEKTDICNKNNIRYLLNKYKPFALINLAAETHVDNSIKNANRFIKTNIVGTHNLISEFNRYINIEKKFNYKFIHISTDEVFGELKLNSKPFTEKNKYFPNSPYSASKASSDHLVRSWIKTYDFPAIITNCSNNFGPFQHEEKLIPKIIKNALNIKPIPIYGNGKQIRDWLYVDDHSNAIIKILYKGKIGESYNIGGNNEFTNIQIAKIICKNLDLLVPLENKFYKSYSDLITFVSDRLGHDFRYAINSNKIRKNLKWKPKYSIQEAINKTISWYNKN